MTSRVSFYKVMIQDLRHRLWMIALSCLGSFLAMPVFYLLIKDEWENRISRWTVESAWDIEAYKIECMNEFFTGYLTITGGIILGVGALIVGIWGFRHVFSKKMVDQYHSIPIKRKDLFLVNYINGFLIWFVPMFIGGLICAVMAAFFMGSFSGWMLYVVKPFLILLANFVIAFLLIYNMTVVAVMLSGNILNTLVNGTIISFVVIGLYGMVEVFCDTYFMNYYSFFEENLKNIIWASPIPSAIYQLYMYAVGNMFVFPVVMNIIMIVVMFAAGFMIYLKRPSELAEQGTKIKSVQVIFKTAVTVLAGLAGWWFFYMITGRLSWEIFGTVLTAVLCYGIMDIVFHMDFKAFFAHKIQLCVTVAVTILVGFTFYFDWVGYDSYMPDKEDIADMGIYVNNYYGISDFKAYDGLFRTKNRIDKMSYKDQDAIYAFLERMTDKEDQYPENGASTYACVRVTEKNGKTYYREYSIWESDEEVVVPILADESYLRTNMLIPQVVIDDAQDAVEYGRVYIENAVNTLYLEDVSKDTAFVQALLEAYNADILENPELYIYQDEEVLANVFYRSSGEYVYFTMDVYESMENVIQVLEKYDAEVILEEISAEKVENITIDVYAHYNQTLSGQLGLDKEEATESDITAGTVNLNPNSIGGMEAATEITVVDGVAIAENIKTTAQTAVVDYYQATITETEDVAEILEVVTWMTPRNRSIFSESYCDASVYVLLKDGSNYHGQLKEGKLPEKFLDYFEYYYYE